MFIFLFRKIEKTCHTCPNPALHSPHMGKKKLLMHRWSWRSGSHGPQTFIFFSFSHYFLVFFLFTFSNAQVALALWKSASPASMEASAKKHGFSMVFIYVYTHMYTHICIHTHAYTYICKYLCTPMYIGMHIYTLYACILF